MLPDKGQSVPRTSSDQPRSFFIRAPPGMVQARTNLGPFDTPDASKKLPTKFVPIPIDNGMVGVD